MLEPDPKILDTSQASGPSMGAKLSAPGKPDKA
jgi:hypothetical protein